MQKRLSGPRRINKEKDANNPTQPRDCHLTLPLALGPVLPSAGCRLSLPGFALSWEENLDVYFILSFLVTLSPAFLSETFLRRSWQKSHKKIHRVPGVSSPGVDGVARLLISEAYAVTRLLVVVFLHSLTAVETRPCLSAPLKLSPTNFSQQAQLLSAVRCGIFT